MHQALKGVACDLLNFLCETLSCVPEVDPWIKDVSLPSEFTRALRPLNRLSVFKASELKTFLLYFSPIVFAPFMTEHQGNLRDLSYMVYALRSPKFPIIERKIRIWLFKKPKTFFS